MTSDMFMALIANSPKCKTGFPWTVSSSDTPPQYADKILPKISIITPSFNQGGFIEETICSVLLQNYPNLEFIIIDGGSIDETVEILKKYDKWLYYWVSEPDKGQSDAINKGLERATGTFFNWLNSDDLLAPNALWAIAETILSAPMSTALVGHLGYFDAQKQLKQTFRMPIFPNEIEKTLFFGGMAQPALFWHTETVRALKNVDKRLHYCMDLELWCRYLTTFGTQNITQINAVLAHFRIHEAAKSSQGLKPFVERMAFSQALLSNLRVPKFWIQKLAISETNLPFEKKYDFSNPLFSRQKLIAYLIEYVLRVPDYNYPLSKSLLLWVFSLYNLPLGRRLYFFTLPLRLIYRKWKKISQLGK